MAITNYDRVGKAMELLKTGLGPFVEREIKAAGPAALSPQVRQEFASDPMLFKKPVSEWDVAALLKLMNATWMDIFKNILGYADRTLVIELRDHRNKWAHQQPFSSDDAYRVLDSASRLLAAVSAPEGEELERMKMELLRVRYEEQVRSEKRRSAGTALESALTGQLKPWREVITPHPDVRSGRYQQAEFAADLWQVHLGEGSDEYRKPAEFFRRTYLTESLKGLLVNGLQRLTGGGGDPVVQLQTNFGGGKTHSMLALYHLFSGASPSELSGIEPAMAEAGVESLPQARRAVLVGNKISPGNPVTKPDGTVVHTLWGELAWQLGGRQAYERVRLDDERATSPGDALRELFNEYSPCLVLVDEWVAYARQLHDQGILPGGGFETQFSFAQALTESAKLARNCLLVISLPASDTAGSPHTQADDVEVGGQRGREALDRLRNVVGRIESSWRPASAEEGFEIVRRRLFEPMVDPAQFRDRDVVARAFSDFYRSQFQEFPPECREADYEKRIQAAYPIHPEVFDRLYTDWSTLVKFQRTRGVLRLMAAVIHSLWEKGDRNPLIQPANIPLDDPRVQFELTRYLSDNWVPILEKDIDGPNSLPLRIDTVDAPNLGKYSACRRVARAIYLGSAPITSAANRGLEDRRVKLGCLLPGEAPAVFGDALRRLAAAATYLYQDGARFWYDTQPTVTKLAEDRAEQFKREPDKIVEELERRLKTDLGLDSKDPKDRGRRQGDFRRIHCLPGGSASVADLPEAGLVVLGSTQAYTKEEGNAALVGARQLLEKCGSTPRLRQNTLVFLAPDKTRFQDLDVALRVYLAWKSVVDEEKQLDLREQQKVQARTQLQSAESVVLARLPETYQWLLVPVQAKPSSPVTWEATRLTGQDPLAVRASRKLKNDELLVTNLAPTRLRMELDRVPLWRGDHVPVRLLVEDFSRYLYLPRLVEPKVLLDAIQAGFGLLTWEHDSFAYADSYDEPAGRYKGLRGGDTVPVGEEDAGLLVKPEVARRQLDAEAPKPVVPRPVTPPVDVGSTGSGGGTIAPPPPPPPPPVARGPRRFHGTVDLDADRTGRDAGRIADEVIAHLSGLVGSNVRVTLMIHAEFADGAPDHVVRTVTENSRTLKFTSHGFERE